MEDLKQDIVDYLSEYHSGRDTDLNAIEAAEHIVTMLSEPRIRAMIAQEILTGTNTFIVPQTVRYHDFKSGRAAARAAAARIAKGPQQTIGG